MNHIFREYDIRGVADTDLSDSFTWALGKTLAKRAAALGEKNIYICRDARLSGPRLQKALSHGLKAGGLNVKLIDPGPTPLLYFSTFCDLPGFPTKSGIMVTGSHNPAEYNGFKMLIAGETIHGKSIQALKEDVSRFMQEAPSTFEDSFENSDIESLYLEHITKNIELKKKLKVVVDAGNGAAGEIAPKLYKALGCEVVELFCKPDGTFPNHHPDPTVAKNLVDLQKKVSETQADLGIAFDGDGDRIGAVSAKGQILYGDQLMLYFARDILKEKPGATIISEVKSSQILYDLLAKWGAKPIMWKTGHSLIKEKLKETKAELAGEMSGHIFFAHRYYGFDDAVYSGARLLESLSERIGNENLDNFLDSLPKLCSTPENRIDCDESQKFSIVEAFVKKAKEDFGDKVNDIDGARISFGNGAWGLLRASNTQASLVFRFEAKSEEELDKISTYFINSLSDYKNDIDLKLFKSRS